ncbi:restriction endonuclease subunit S [Companilactobacillus futsaii]|uniref:Restriction endonuclease subunit S n=2 Tax=Companilactobacillus futsaii TaxID=938155 RepID=A0A5B7SZN7_9LACO|nr:restriction endonuclease subunit S [Companilactobacillus futsaii]KRK93063.1 restriction modification system DNA specificity domain protein [Companilactobacillus futsaii JCM 17355]QCX25277.1 restriction endonuclease subunit S [Companilactobacillus futsaii]
MYITDWEQHSFQNTLIIHSGKDYKHLNKGNIPVYGTGGYMLSVDEKLSKVDGIGLGRKGTIDKPQYLKAPFWTVDTLFYMTPKSNFEILFLYAIVQKFNWKKLNEASGVPSLSKKTIEKVMQFYPTQLEQKKLGYLLKIIAETIALQQQQLNLYIKLKKGLLQKLFPKNGEMVPEIRFADFTGDWEQHKLGTLIVPFNKTTTINNQYPVLTSSRKGLFFQTDYYDGNQIASKNNIGYNIVPRGYFTYRHMSDDLIFKFNINNLVDNGIVSTLYPVFTVNNKLDSEYLKYQLNDGEEFKRFAITQKQGGSRTYMYLSKLKKLLLTIPNLDEQVEISNFLDSLNSVINLQQEKLNELEALKKYLLQKLFI